MKPFNSFVNNLDNRIERALKFMAVANTLEGRTVIYRKADRLEKWADKNLTNSRRQMCSPTSGIA